MTGRILQLLIVMLWLVSTTLLVQRTYFPNEAGFAAASPKLISDLYFAKSESTDLVLLRDGQPFGRISMTLPPKNRSARYINFWGHLETDLEAGITSLQWTGSVLLDDQLGLRGLRLVPRSLDLEGQLEVDFEPPSLHYKLAQHGQVLLDSRNVEATQQTMKLLGPMAKQSGLDLSFLGQPGSKDLESMIMALRPQVNARHGQFQINSNRYEGYVVTYSFLEEAKLRLYFSDQGELLKADGPPNITLLAETFVTRRVPPPRPLKTKS